MGAAGNGGCDCISFSSKASAASRTTLKSTDIFSFVQLKSLHDSGNHTIRTWIIRIQIRGQAQVIGQQLREDNFERYTQMVREVRRHGRNEVVGQIACGSGWSDDDQVAKILLPEFPQQILFVTMPIGIG